VAGRIVRVDPLRNLDHILPTQATSSLPVIGGRSECVVNEPFDLRIEQPRPLLLFGIKSARTFAETPIQRKPGVWITNVHSEVHGLRLLDGAITVEDIVADIRSEHTLDEDCPRITPIKCEILGMKLAGMPLEIGIDLDPFQAAPTKSSIEDHMRKDPGLKGRIGWRHARRRAKAVAECHIIARWFFPKGRPDGVDSDSGTQNPIIWKGIGRIFVGEFLIGNLSRRLTALRIALGCPIEGEFVAGEVETDGHTFP